MHRHLGFPFGDHDSQIAITLGRGALEVPGHGASFIPREPPSRQSEFSGVKSLSLI
jgi:hypothetical protein